jgi:hypothetical protein
MVDLLLIVFSLGNRFLSVGQRSRERKYSGPCPGNNCPALRISFTRRTDKNLGFGHLIQ